MRYFEDLRIGDVMVQGRHTFTAGEIKSFARRFDPQHFHVDEEAAAGSHFGALCASGWHTGAVWMRIMVDTRRAEADAMRARGETPAAAGPALGLRDVKWTRPVYVGDTIEYTSEIIELRVSNSRPGFALMSFRTTGVNQDGVPVMSFISTSFIERRKDATGS